MPIGRPKAELALSEAEHAQLNSMARSRSLSAAMVMRRASCWLLRKAHASNKLAERMQLTNATVCKWRRRFLEARISGLHDELLPGKPRTIDDERVAELINTTLHTKPADGSTHWSIRAVAAEGQDLADQRAPLLQAAGPATASQRNLQAVDRCILHREVARRRGSVS
jgi:putative transposase